MNKIIWLILALIVPSLGMAKSKSVLDGLKPDQCLGVKDGKYIDMPCAASASLNPIQEPSSWTIGAIPMSGQTTWELLGGSTNEKVFIGFEHGIVYLNGVEMVAGGAPPQHSKPHLKATATAGTVTVQWTDTSAGAGIGYLIRAGATSGGEATTPITPSMIDVGQACTTTAAYCTYTDTAVTPGVQKCYTVAATDGATRTSPYATTDACVTVPLPALSAPVLGPPIVN